VRQRWSARLAEVPYLIGWESSREVVLAGFAIVATPIVAMRLVFGPDRWQLSLILAVCLLADGVVVKIIDGRIGVRSSARTRWADPAFLDQARRYRLQPVTGHEVLLGTGTLQIAGSARPLGDPRSSIGVLQGVVHGRPVVLTEMVTLRGPQTPMVLGITRLRREHPRIRLGPDTRLVRRPGERTPFERLFRLRGEGAPEVGLALQAWLVDNATGMGFEVQKDLLVCRRTGEAILTTEEIGRYLAALVGFASRLEGRTPPPGA
jgi:hypothetical protein